MSAGTPPDRDECIEQAYFYRVFRDRLSSNLPAQDILVRMPEELLASTRLPMAVQFLATEMRHSGQLATGYARLLHYFTPFQVFVVGQAERDRHKFSMEQALLVLEREATYKAGSPTHSGLFVYQFESIARNRLGYDDGLTAMERDPFYPTDWGNLAGWVRKQLGVVDFADLVYVRSEAYVTAERRTRPDYTPPVPALFGEKEGRIAAASRGRDPLFLFAALQRQLDYPEVPRPRPKDDLGSKLLAMETKFREMEARIRMLESGVRGTFDPTQFGKPDLFRDLQDE